MSTRFIDPDTRLEELLLAAPEWGPVLERFGVPATRDRAGTLAEFCDLHGLELHTVARMLEAMRAASPPCPVVCLELMTLDQVCDHLESAHRDLQEELQRADQLIKTLVKQTAAEHPKLLTIQKCFVAFHRRLKAHLRAESGHLFPVLRKWQAATNGGRCGVNRLRLPLARLEREHDQADESLAALRGAIEDESSCSSTHAGMRAIAEAVGRLDRSVHEQIYKENRLLFPNLRLRLK